MTNTRSLVGGLTHCIAASFSLVALVLLIVFASIWGNAYHIVTYTIFGTSMFLMYLFSTLYHWLNLSGKALIFFKKFDQILSYIFIAATYTPICLVLLRGPWGWSIFGVIWGLVTCAIIMTAIWTKIPKALTYSLFFTISSIILIAIVPLINALNALNMFNSFWWLLVGAIFYFIGGLSYILKWPKINAKHFTNHELLHIFMILGTIPHFWLFLHHFIQIN